MPKGQKNANIFDKKFQQCQDAKTRETKVTSEMLHLGNKDAKTTKLINMFKKKKNILHVEVL